MEDLGEGDTATANWTDTGIHPWRRYAARLTDMLTIGLAISIVGGFVAYGVAPDAADAWLAEADTPVGRFRDTIILLVLMAPISAAFIGATGLSPGKWIFGVRVLKDGARSVSLRPFDGSFPFC